MKNSIKLSLKCKSSISHAMQPKYLCYYMISKESNSRIKIIIRNIKQISLSILKLRLTSGVESSIKKVECKKVLNFLL